MKKKKRPVFKTSCLIMFTNLVKENRMKAIPLLLFLTLLACYGCGSIVHDATQDTSIVTYPEDVKTKATNGMEWIKRSNDSMSSGNWAEVIRTASAAITKVIDPINLENAYLNRAWAYYRKGFFDESVNDSSQAIKINSKSILGYNYRALAYSEKGQTDQAFQEIDKAIQLDGKNPVTLNSKGVIYQKQGNKPEALRNYKTSCEFQYQPGCDNYKLVAGFYPADIPRIVNQLIDESNQCFQEMDWEGVIQKTSEALKLDSANAIAYTNRAGAYANKKMLKEASNDCNEAVTINPNYPLAYNNRGYVQEQLGQRTKAQLDYEIACNLGLDLACKNMKNLSDK